MKVSRHRFQKEGKQGKVKKADGKLSVWTESGMLNSVGFPLFRKLLSDSCVKIMKN